MHNLKPTHHTIFYGVLHFIHTVFSLCPSFYEGSNIAWKASEMQIVKFKLIDKEYMMNTNISATRKWFNRHWTQDEWNRQYIASYCKCLEVNCHSQIVIYKEYYLPFQKLTNIIFLFEKWRILPYKSSCELKHSLLPMWDNWFLL